MHRCVYWLLKVFLIFIYSGKVWQAMQIKMDMWRVGNFCPFYAVVLYIWHITLYYNTMHMFVYVLCSFLLPKARNMSYWQSSSKPVKARTRCAKRTLSLADELLFVLMRLKVMTARVQTVQPKMSSGTVRELCVFGRSGDFLHYCSNPSAYLYGS